MFCAPIIMMTREQDQWFCIVGLTQNKHRVGLKTFNLRIVYRDGRCLPLLGELALNVIKSNPHSVRLLAGTFKVECIAYCFLWRIFSVTAPLSAV